MDNIFTALVVGCEKVLFFTAGVYKPRVRCYDVHQLSMKFERCVDAEVVNFKMLSDDYSKVCIFIMFVILLSAGTYSLCYSLATDSWSSMPR